MKVFPRSVSAAREGLSALVCAWLALVLGACSAEVTGSQAARPAGSAGTSAAQVSAAAGSGVTSSQPVRNAGSAGSVASGPTAVAASSCASGQQVTDPVTPTVWLVVDGSTSMNDDFVARSSRWDALRETLVGPGGIVESLQSGVRFGLVIYAGGDGDSGECVQLVTLEPELNALAKISAQYPAQPLAAGTPTDKALDYVVSNLAVTNMPVLDTHVAPVYVVLATDGSPNDNCGAGGGGRNNNTAVEQRVIDVTTRGTAAGMNMFVISLAGSDTRLQSHLALVADATSSRTPPFTPATQSDLISAFREIVGGATCQLGLVGSVTQGAECNGHVALNGVQLKCNDPDGWQLLDARTVQINGKACETFTSTHSLIDAQFPCEVFTPD